VALGRKQAQPSFFVIKNLDGGGWFNVTLSKYLLIEHMIHVVQNMNTSDNKKLLSALMAIRTPAEYHRVHKPDVLTEDASSNGPTFQGAQKRWYALTVAIYEGEHDADLIAMAKKLASIDYDVFIWATLQTLPMTLGSCL